MLLYYANKSGSGQMIDTSLIYFQVQINQIWNSASRS